MVSCSPSTFCIRCNSDVRIWWSQYNTFIISSVSKKIACFCSIHSSAYSEGWSLNRWWRTRWCSYISIYGTRANVVESVRKRIFGINITWNMKFRRTDSSSTISFTYPNLIALGSSTRKCPASWFRSIEIRCSIVIERIRIWYTCYMSSIFRSFNLVIIGKLDLNITTILRL